MKSFKGFLLTEGKFDFDDLPRTVPINGKKRGLLSTKKDIEEKEVVAKAKNIENIRKNLTNKKIIKNVFVKNKVINFIIA